MGQFREYAIPITLMILDDIILRFTTSDNSTNITATIASNITYRHPSFNIDIGHWEIPQNI